MLRSLALSSMLLARTFSVSSADVLNGTISDPSLRRKIDLVYIEKVEAAFPATPATMNQRGNTYRPHVLPVLVGTKVVFKSEDPELHNVFARRTKAMMFNDAVLPGAQIEREFKQLGVVHLTCNIHKEMSGYVVVLQNPYYATIDHKSGVFMISGIPAGSYTLRIWGEALTDEQNSRTFPVTVGGAGSEVKVAEASR